MKILSANQIRESDKATIANEPISSVLLMDRAARNMADYLRLHFVPKTHFVLLCGKGNNGGDGLCMAQYMSNWAAIVEVLIIEHSETSSEDYLHYYSKLQDYAISVTHINSTKQLKQPPSGTIIIDAILGAGLSRKLDGFLKDVIAAVNSWEMYKIAVDIPTGLFADDNSNNDLNFVLQPDLTLSLQLPKLSMVHANTARICGNMKVIDIGIDPGFLEEVKSTNFYLLQEEVQNIFAPRKKFTYKGTYGHGLLIAGSQGMIGACVLAGTAAMRGGIGLLTIHCPPAAVNVIHSLLPEAMILDGVQLEDNNDFRALSHKYNALAIGPGLSTSEPAIQMMKQTITHWNGPMVIDADGLNILVANREWLKLLPQGTILTPHIGEFKRLLGEPDLPHNYLERLKKFSMDYQVTVVLKDAITAIADNDGNSYFSDFGDASLATAGSGDVLCGLLLALLANGYAPTEAAKLGVYLHSRAGVLAGLGTSQESALASDIAMHIGAAYRELY